MPFFHEIINLSKDEEIVKTFRSHPAVLVLATFPFACALIVICLFVFPLLTLGTKGILVFFLLICLDVVFIGTIISQWIGTIVIVTTRRIIKIDRRSFLKKYVNEYQLETITEIAYDSKGLLQTVFALGDINITALYTGSKYTIIKHVPKPQHVLDIISHTISHVQKKNDHIQLATENLYRVAVSGDEKKEE